MLACASIRWHIAYVAFASICWHMVVYASISSMCWHALACASRHWHALAYASICYHMLVFTNIMGYMASYAHICQQCWQMLAGGSNWLWPNSQSTMAGEIPGDSPWSQLARILAIAVYDHNNLPPLAISPSIWHLIHANINTAAPDPPVLLVMNRMVKSSRLTG